MEGDTTEQAPAPAETAATQPEPMIYRGEGWNGVRPENVPEWAWDKDHGGVNIDRAIKRVSDAQEALLNRPKPPETYSVDLPEGFDRAISADHPMAAGLLAVAKKHGLSQEAVTDTLAMAAEAIASGAMIEAEFGKLEKYYGTAEKADAALTALGQRAKAFAKKSEWRNGTSTDVADAMNRLCETAAGVEFLSKVLDTVAPSYANPSGAASEPVNAHMSIEEAKMVMRDADYYSNPIKQKRVEAAFAAAYPGKSQIAPLNRGEVMRRG